MRKLKKAKFINPSIYPVYIGYVNTEKAWKRLMKHLKIFNPPEFAECGNCTTFESSSGGLTIVISCNHKALKHEPKRTAYSMLAHEAKHAHDAIMDHIKEFKRDGECSAYTIDWLVREGAKAFKL
jgi:hypothetical protein